MTSNELSELREALVGDQRGCETRYTMELRKRVVLYAEGRRRTGTTWAALAEELGIRYETIRRWCGLRGGENERVSLRRVEVVSEKERTAIAVVSPSGVRVEGLTLEDAAFLLRALG